MRDEKKKKRLKGVTRDEVTEGKKFKAVVSNGRRQTQGRGEESLDALERQCYR